jgi:hypothetical protein
MFGTIAREIRERGEYRLGRYGSFWHRFALVRPRLAIELLHFEDHWSLHLIFFMVNLCDSQRDPEEGLERWGFYWFMSSLVLCWRIRRKTFRMPWDYDHCQQETLLEDGTFAPGSPDSHPAAYLRRMLYCYTLRGGRKQYAMASLSVERRTWCWHGWPFRWLRWPRKVRTAIRVNFNREIGEQAGSWKGGCTGCGYDLMAGETPEQCLRRMERERVFN